MSRECGFKDSRKRVLYPVFVAFLRDRPCFGPGSIRIDRPPGSRLREARHGDLADHVLRYGIPYRMIFSEASKNYYQKNLAG